jgi:hypothetical protein
MRHAYDWPTFVRMRHTSMRPSPRPRASVLLLEVATNE